MNSNHSNLTRRGFLKASSLGVAGGSIQFPMTAIAQSIAIAVESPEVVTWSACTVNCGSRCPLKVVSKNGQIIRIEPDDSGLEGCTASGAAPHIRSCLRGRSMRQRVYSHERLKYPMKRVGKRGDGAFERISWDEALDIVAEKLKGTISKYGNAAVCSLYATGTYQLVSGKNASTRLFNLLGGSLGQYGTYSSSQIVHAMSYTYGTGAYGSYMTEMQRAKLVVCFGNNPMMTRQSGGGQAWEYQCALSDAKPRVVLIDPIYTDSMLGKEDEWVPIRPGTDAALVEGMAFVLITESLVDQAFLDQYCVGYDDKSLPASASRHSGYKSYILGRGTGGVPKTPAWASRICGVPEETIVRLAREIASTKPVFFSQGWGVQRHANGEQQARAIAMLPLLTGNIGVPGTNNGAREGDFSLRETGLPVGKNPVKAQIPFFLWTDAIVRGAEMSEESDGVRGVKRLDQPIKFIWCHATNTLINQHSNTNRTHEILRDEEKCEFIVVVENQMTASARYADILLPDVMQQEANDLVADSYASGAIGYLVALQKAVSPLWEQRSAYEICRGIASRFGLEDKFTEGRTQEQWVEWCYEETRKKHADLPPFAEFWRRGVVRVRSGAKDGVILRTFREDPVKNKLKTPSGKIEIYSERLAKIAAEWNLPKGDVISPLPQYVTTFESHLDAKAKKFPLQAFGLHGHGRTHSTYHNIPWLRELHPDLLLINPVDAGKRGIKNGDKVQVFNDRGTVELPAKVSPRIMPGVVSFPQGAWYQPNAKGVDVGACINTLTSQRPTPLAKANPQHTNLVEVRKA